MNLNLFSVLRIVHKSRWTWRIPKSRHTLCLHSKAFPIHKNSKPRHIFSGHIIKFFLSLSFGLNGKVGKKLNVFLYCEPWTKTVQLHNKDENKTWRKLIGKLKWKFLLWNKFFFFQNLFSLSWIQKFLIVSS